MASKYSQISAHSILLIGTLLIMLPIWIVFASSTHDSLTLVTKGMQFGLGDNFLNNYQNVLFEKGGFSKEVTFLRLLTNSLVMAFGIATLTVITSLLAAYTIVYLSLIHI